MYKNVYKVIVAILLLTMVGQATASAFLSCQSVVSHKDGEPDNSLIASAMPACHDSDAVDSTLGLVLDSNLKVTQVMLAHTASDNSAASVDTLDKKGDRTEKGDCAESNDCCPGACVAVTIATANNLELLYSSFLPSYYSLALTQGSDTLFRPPISR